MSTNAGRIQTSKLARRPCPGNTLVESSKASQFPLFLSFFFFLCSSSTTIVVEPNLTAFASAFALSSHPSSISHYTPLSSSPTYILLHCRSTCMHHQPTFKIFGHESVLRSYLIFTHLFPPRRPSYRSTFRRHSSGRGPHLDACFGCTTASLSPLAPLSGHHHLTISIILGSNW